MIEIYKNIPDYVKTLTDFWVNRAIKCNNPILAVTMISNFKSQLLTQEEKDFVDFYFDMKMEQLKNENNND